MISAANNALKFSGLICHNTGGRHDPENGSRIFRFELTNDTSLYPLGQVVCPESGLPGNSDPTVAFLSQCLPQLAMLNKENRLEVMRQLIRLNSGYWQIGKNLPTDVASERLSDRGMRLLQQSTADIQQNPNGTLSMIMDYDPDQRGISLTQMLKQAQHPQTQGIDSPTTGSRLQLSA